MASRYDGRGETPTITRRRHVLACARCRARRVKCDRAQPACSNCSKAGALCQPAQQQQLAPPSTSGSSRTGKRDPGDRLRLSKLEEEVARLSRGLDSKSPSREPSVPGSPVDTDAGWPSQNQGMIWYGNQTRYFGPASWASLPDEVADIRTLLGDNDSAAFESASEPAGPSPLDSSSSESEMELPLPNDQLHETLLSLYSHRVDSLVRVLHWPSFVEQSRAFRRRKAAKLHAPEGTTFSNTYYADPSFDPSQQGMYSTTPIVPSQSSEQLSNTRSLAAFDLGFTALLYSVYYAAVVSVIDSPNPPDLGRNINAFSLAATFKREVTNRVMSLDAKVARSESLEMLQAMVLHLSVEPSSFDSQLQWLQLGAAIRLAQSLGVHRDGSQFDLRPIESETRRRLWAQICVLDTRIGEHLGREPTISIDTYDTALPLSISDSDLSEIDEHDAASRRGKETNFKTYQEIEQGLERRSPFSPMTFSLVETESARMMAQLATRRLRARDSIFQSQLSRSSSMARSEQSHWISRFEHRFRTVYDLDSLDSSHPMQYLIAEMANVIILKAKFINNMLQWREAYGRMEESRRDAERDELLRAAVVISIRSLTLIHQYSSTPYGWYTKRLRDVTGIDQLIVVSIEPTLPRR
ncbi:fungal-specific transcription factor domain-containing protein [Lophiotrema nucula]|uniref:Fungal-specific transcription factor domain-containing protein n=1 Tax=Lophiotrema nucula TaxID=690887 RepID=A0A6A5Z0X0_9PLEO|nr:fungal-specific transcription factor domain-containing protein [Lophiotrema nucula]